MNQNKLFFSIVIPAHNEEKYIEETLINIKNLNYPADNFETIVVENGSTDKTTEVAKKFESLNIKIFSSTEKGVSKARNFGARQISPKSEWTVFLDADTILKAEFLNDLNDYLQKNITKNYSVGTTTLLPSPDSRKARLWFAFYDIGHKIFKVSSSIQIIKTSVLKTVEYDEVMARGEDIKIIKGSLKYGKFFIFKTKTVYTSTRRFEQVGWWKLLFNWTILASMPISVQKKFDYEIVR